MNEYYQTPIQALEDAIDKRKAEIASLRLAIDCLRLAEETTDSKAEVKPAPLEAEPTKVVAPSPEPVAVPITPKAEVTKVTSKAVEKHVVAPKQVKLDTKDVSRPPLKQALCMVMGTGIMTAQEALDAMVAKGWPLQTANPKSYISMTLSSKKELFEAVERGKYRVLAQAKVQQVAPPNRKAAPVAKAQADATLASLVEEYSGTCPVGEE